MKRKRLLWQIFPLYLLITLISIGAVSGFMMRSFKYFYLELTASGLKSRAYLLKEQIDSYLLQADYESIDILCKKIGDPSSTRISVVLPSGRVVGESHNSTDKLDNHQNRPELREAFNGRVGTNTRYSRTLQMKMMYVAIPVMKNEAVTAAIRTALSITSLDNELAFIRNRILFGGLLIALLAAGISLVISQRISRPIEQMKQGASRFASGDLAYRLSASGSEEMVKLAEAMNRMAAHLDERIAIAIRQKNEIEAVLSSMAEGVIALDSDEHVINMNQAAANIFNVDMPRSQGRFIQEVIRNTQLHLFVRKALASTKNVEDDIRFFKGDERILYCHSTPLRDASEKLIGTLIVLNDVTRLRQLENMRRDFVANVTHELKTPLTAIKGFVETIRDGGGRDSDETDRFLGIVSKHVDRLSAIIEDLLNLSRIEREEELNQIQFRACYVKDMIQTAIQTCYARAKEKNIQIEFNGDPELMVRVDPRLIEQAAVNLLDNAIKYSEQNDSLHVSVVTSDTEISIFFKDNGIGIPKEHLPRLFERFYRVDKARSRKLGGTGLGLSIVKHIVTAHGGRVTVESAVGKGSTFGIHLPRT